jgi:hypothetical protein
MLENWNKFYKSCHPIGYPLREAFPERWVRFHSLPQSKRYPVNEDEYQELLARHNAVLSYLATPGESVVLVTTGYTKSPIPTRTYEQLFVLDPRAKYWRSLNESEDDSLSYWHFFTSLWDYVESQFDDLIRLVADDIVSNVLIVSFDCRWIIHPYDGGMDVILESTNARNELRNQFELWLSARPDGM